MKVRHIENPGDYFDIYESPEFVGLNPELLEKMPSLSADHFHEVFADVFKAHAEYWRQGLDSAEVSD